MKTKKNLRSFLSKIFGTKKKDPVPEKEIPVPDSEESINEEAEKTIPESIEKITKSDLAEFEKWRDAQPYVERTGAFVINIPSPSGRYYKKDKKSSDDQEDRSSDLKE